MEVFVNLLVRLVAAMPMLGSSTNSNRSEASRNFSNLQLQRQSILVCAKKCNGVNENSEEIRGIGVALLDQNE
jgi:hypothetical protein